jgi:hypothetical protein
MDHMGNFRERFEALERRTQMVEQRLRWWRGITCGVVLLAVFSLALPSGKASDALGRGMSDRMATLEKKLAAMDFDDAANEVVISGANLRIVNGLGNTETTNGLGNLIVGYNEPRPPGESPPDIRTGSHNIVVGEEHNFSSFGGLVVGFHNEISGEFASISGGEFNFARGRVSSVSGGFDNTASGYRASISGGGGNRASENSSSVSGGTLNRAEGIAAAVSGGRENTASGFESSVSGGTRNTASGMFSPVSGGQFNMASGDESSVSGGRVNAASGESASVSGGADNKASGGFASVSGGQRIQRAAVKLRSAADAIGARQGYSTGPLGPCSPTCRHSAFPEGQRLSYLHLTDEGVGPIPDVPQERRSLAGWLAPLEEGDNVACGVTQVGTHARGWSCRHHGFTRRLASAIRPMPDV